MERLNLESLVYEEKIVLLYYLITRKDQGYYYFYSPQGKKINYEECVTKFNYYISLVAEGEDLDNLIYTHFESYDLSKAYNAIPYYIKDNIEYIQKISDAYIYFYIQEIFYNAFLSKGSAFYSKNRTFLFNYIFFFLRNINDVRCRFLALFVEIDINDFMLDDVNYILERAISDNTDLDLLFDNESEDFYLWALKYMINHDINNRAIYREYKNIEVSNTIYTMEKNIKEYMNDDENFKENINKCNEHFKEQALFYYNKQKLGYYFIDFRIFFNIRVDFILMNTEEIIDMLNKQKRNVKDIVLGVFSFILCLIYNGPAGGYSTINSRKKDKRLTRLLNAWNQHKYRQKNKKQRKRFKQLDIPLGLYQSLEKIANEKSVTEILALQMLIDDYMNKDR